MQAKEMIHIVEPFKNRLYRYALNILKDPMEAEDVVQEILIKIWKKIDQFKHIENKEAWCMTMTRNLSIDKKRKRKYHTESIENFHFVKDTNTTPYESMQSMDHMSSLERLIYQLPEKQRSVLHLRDVEGYTYKEIAAMADISVDQVKVYLHRARKQLRSQINRKDYE